jgi:cobalt-zinc-cadmium efflux system outer membrane protein
MQREPVGRPPQFLDLGDAIETSLARNPDLIALRQNEGVAIGVMGVAQTYPFNPYVQFQATPLQRRPDGSAGATYHYVLLMQTIQLAHQQRYRDEIGSTSLNTVRWNIHQAELLNLATTERLYFTALYLRGLRDLTRDNARLNTELLSVLERQLAAGAVAGADVAIVRLDYRSTQHQAQLAEQAYETALLDLQRQLNMAPGEPLALEGDLTWYNFLPADPSRLAQAVCGSQIRLQIEPVESLRQVAGGRPDVLAAQSDLETARANERLANAMRTPDLQIGPYYQRTDSGTEFYGFRGQTDLLIINTGMPLLRQRQAEVRQRYTVWRQLQVRATLEAQVAVERYERARRLLLSLGDINDRELPIELERLEQQFREGEVDILRLFTARTSLIQNRRTQLDTLNEVAQAAAQVTAATAVPPHVLAVVRRPAGR